MHYDEDDEEYSDLDLDVEDAVERGYEDDKDFDDDKRKPFFGGGFKARSGGGSPSGSSGGSGCLLVLGILGAALISGAGAWLI